MKNANKIYIENSDFYRRAVYGMLPAVSRVHTVTSYSNEIWFKNIIFGVYNKNN